MNLYTTFIRAISPTTGELLTFAGPHIRAISPECARQFCDAHGFGYLHISDELVAEIPCLHNSLAPNLKQIRDYETAKLN